MAGSERDDHPPGTRGTGRVEAFSDGVFAIALTLLVLDLHRPEPGQHVGPLASFLGHQWPSYVAFVTSFLTIGVLWLNHHATLALARLVDHTAQVINLLLLLVVTFLPFPTAVLASYGTGHHSAADGRTAVLLYGATMSAMALAYNCLSRHLLRRLDLYAAPLDPEAVRVHERTFAIGLLAYPVLTAIGLLSLPVFLLGLFALSVVYLRPWPDLRERDRAAARP